ncbi:hypothetical protein ACWDA3_40835 [Nonomuraea rubra]
MLSQRPDTLDYDLRMLGNFDLPSALAVGVRSREEAWSFIRGFADAWVTPLRDGDGFSEAEINVAQGRLGFELPLALREALALFGKRPDLCSTMQQLLPPEKLHLYDSGLLVFHAENQGVWECRIRRSDAGMDDPPVLFSPPCADEDEHRLGVAWFDKLSTACIEIVLTESLYSGDKALRLYGQLLPEDIPLVGQRFVPSALPSYPAEPVECFSQVRWYVGEEAILRLDCYNAPLAYDDPVLPGWNRIGRQADLQVRARTPEALQSIRENLPAEWFNWRRGRYSHA